MKGFVPTIFLTGLLLLGLSSAHAEEAAQAPASQGEKRIL
jgi:hypothetical protein